MHLQYKYKTCFECNAVNTLNSIQLLLSFYALSKHCTSAIGDHYMFSLSHDDCSCLFVTTGSDDTSNPRIFSTCADCLRRMILRGVLEPRGATKLRGASGDLCPAELDPNNLLLAGLTAYDARLLFDDFSSAVALLLTAKNSSCHLEFANLTVHFKTKKTRSCATAQKTAVSYCVYADAIHTASFARSRV